MYASILVCSLCSFESMRSVYREVGELFVHFSHFLLDFIIVTSLQIDKAHEHMTINSGSGAQVGQQQAAKYWALCMCLCVNN